jgi:predicted NAD/FAD-binding protein
MKIAVIGAGAAGLGAAWALAQRHEVVLYDAEARAGGHAHTLEVQGPDGPVAVDGGFIVYNEPNYPNLARLFAALGVRTQASAMSFAVSLDRGAYEYAGSPAGLFAQPANLLRPAHWRMVAEIPRFFRAAQALVAGGALDDRPAGTLGQWLAREGFSQGFVERHLLPMAAAIWSAPAAEILDFPLPAFLRFFRNHGLLQARDRPQWRTVSGGSRQYVARVLRALGPRALRLSQAVRRLEARAGGWSVIGPGGHRESADAVVLACHADQSLAILGAAADARERALLGSIRYSDNRAVLHGDAGLMPRRRRVWSSWNYLGERGGAGAVSVTYWMNRLQGLDPRLPLFVSLNPLRDPDPALTHAAWHCSHPIFDQAALAAQRALPAIQGQRGLWYAGSWCGYGFHEDALASGLAVAAALGSPAPWQRPAELAPPLALAAE